MRSTTTVVYCAVDRVITASNQALSGFGEFLEGLGEANIPFVALTSRSRLQFDAALRKLGLGHPFVAEGGCGVYLPEDYFHLKPPRSTRFGRFTCIPVAEALPAAAELLETLSGETGIETVPLRGLSPRELSQNVGLPEREAELVRQRDFDELFFFAGASDADIRRFQGAAEKQNAQARPRGGLWSLAVKASLAACLRDLSQLYQRSFRAPPQRIGIATQEESAELFPSCDRCLLLTGKEGAASSSRWKQLPLASSKTWEEALEAILNRDL